MVKAVAEAVAMVYKKKSFLQIIVIYFLGRGRGRGRRGQRTKEDTTKAWVPVTKLGRLVNDGKIRSLEEIYLFSLPIKVCSFLEFFIFIVLFIFIC